MRTLQKRKFKLSASPALRNYLIIGTTTTAMELEGNMQPGDSCRCFTKGICIVVNPEQGKTSKEINLETHLACAKQQSSSSISSSSRQQPTSSEARPRKLQKLTNREAPRKNSQPVRTEIVRLLLFGMLRYVIFTRDEARAQFLRPMPNAINHLPVPPHWRIHG